MKKRLLIACTMQIDVIQSIRKKYAPGLPVIWMERTLHDQPYRLHKRIQKCIDEHQDVDEILLSYGLCGNAAEGLYSADTKLIFSCFDDCICQLLCEDERQPDRKAAAAQKGCYYLTREWTADSQAVVQQCEQIYGMYGRDEGTKIIQEIYADYHTLVLLQTGAYDVEKLRDYADKAAEYTGMRVKVQKASTKVIKNLIMENDDKRIRVLNPGERIKRNMFHS